MSHESSPHLQHHFDTAEQQFDAGKLGIWLFLATEILLFGGLFCAYAIYRAIHPEIFVYAHQFLDKVLGGTNTVILLCSSLTMAWAVRASQLGQRRLLIALLSLTLLGGFGFMGIKYVEYKAKWEHGLLPGTHFAHHEEGEAEAPSAAPASPAPSPAAATGTAASASPAPSPAAKDAAASTNPAVTLAASGAIPPLPPTPAPTAAASPTPIASPPARPAPTPAGGGASAPASAASATDVKTTIKPAARGPSGTVTRDEAKHREAALHGKRPSNVQIFFGIYFLMTGLHGLHVLAGMGAITWILIRSIKGHFGPEYFTPVDFVGLYWHLVDLIWIFLFPLLYLIH
jgi:cytochrome c oxidase subunit 3